MWRFLSPAKLNLGLWLLSKRSDGYHEVFTVYNSISLFDEVFIEEGPLSIETSTGIPMEENLVYKALRKMEEVLGREINYRIYIQKNIPEGGGLGGGSSNVATILKAINELMGKPLSLEELHSIAGHVSSDAPFFLYCGWAIGRGRGELLQRLELPKMRFVVICPDVKVSTSYVYRRVKRDMLTGVPPSDKIVDCLRIGDLSLLENRLGLLAAELYPEVGEVLRFLEGLGFRSLVSGSGSCVFYVGEPNSQVELGCRLRGWKLYSVESYGV
ncbi:MAG: 4-(cytidine 5'-diphospho)-2-C-methyl-D-erythritol kinase [Acidobacteria bacterium]|jgi:4-diphosphocytidyl-2-C-methyl-D-erythritol kinase|nr:MAG: 4-(cytidine 5'-diphospho)-2-C-methyl-D-erythritol kinase [Acidobacteriota bacterium]